jgi:long-chain fatty acid transport protein
VYENLDFDFDPDVLYLPDTEGPRNWDDTFAVRIGAEYQLNDMYAVRAGYLFDQSPIPDDTLGPELPTGDRHGIAVGAGVTWRQVDINVCYTHIFLEDRTVETSLRDSYVLGDYESSANIFGISVGYAF